MQPVVVSLSDHSAARSLFDPICQLYGEVFSAASHHWNEDRSREHRKRLTTLVADPSFGLTTAFVGSDLIGLAYGYQLPIKTQWWQGFLEPVPADLTTEREGRSFAVIDLAVRQAWRRQGIGRRLLTALLESRHEERATLAVQPEADAAHAFYRRLRWRYVGRVRGVEGESAPYFDIYWLPLHGAA